MAESRKYGTPVDAVVTCGNLPELRSLTMPLIEELDVEVETLDSLEGLVVKPQVAEKLAEWAPAHPDRVRRRDRARHPAVGSVEEDRALEHRRAPTCAPRRSPRLVAGIALSLVRAREVAQRGRAAPPAASIPSTAPKSNPPR